MRRVIGMDIHRTFAEVVFWEDGRLRWHGRVDMTRSGLEGFGRSLVTDDEVVLEATGNAMAVVRVLSPHVARVIMANPLQVKAIAHAHIKTDKIDAGVLASLHAAGFLPEVWLPDAETERRRRLVARRNQIVRHRTRVKNETHAILAAHLVPPCPHAELFNRPGRAWLAHQVLPDDERAAITRHLRELDRLGEDLAVLDREIAEATVDDPAVRRLLTIAGVNLTVAAGLVAAIRALLAASPFHGEGHRKIWARLRFAGIRTSKRRVLRLMREHGLLAPARVGRPHGPRAHDGTIRTERVDEMWGTDLTSTLTGEGQASIFVTVDHCSTECVGIHAARRATRFEALEPLRQGVRACFGAFGAGVAGGLELRHDHGSQFVADDYQRELAFLGINSSPAFVREPEGNGCVERFIRTLKENLLWVRRFDTIEELRLALHAFRATYNQTWIVERHGYQTPAAVRAAQLAPLLAAA